MKEKSIIALMVTILCLLVYDIIRVRYKEVEVMDLYVDHCVLFIEPEDEILSLMKEENKIEDETAWKERQDKYINLFPDLYVEPQMEKVELERRRICYLSFDDGPSKITSHILDTLKKYNIPATFFVITQDLDEEKKELLRRIVAEGHMIGIHTNSHDYKDIYSSVVAYLEDFNKVYEHIYEITGVKTNIFRFPWGSSNGYNQKIKNELHAEMIRRGFSFYDWNVSAEDSYGQSTEAQIKRNIMKDIDKFQTPIILMHDSSINQNTGAVLDEVLSLIIEKDFIFRTLDQREPYYFP